MDVKILIGHKIQDYKMKLHSPMLHLLHQRKEEN